MGDFSTPARRCRLGRWGIPRSFHARSGLDVSPPRLIQVPSPLGPCYVPCWVYGRGCGHCTGLSVCLAGFLDRLWARDWDADVPYRVLGCGCGTRAGCVNVQTADAQRAKCKSEVQLQCKQRANGVKVHPVVHSLTKVSLVCVSLDFRVACLGPCFRLGLVPESLESLGPS